MKTKHQIKKLFLQFLKDNNVVIPFILNMRDYHTDIPTLTAYIKQQQNEYDLIEAAFIWHHTDEGHHFWSDLSYEWIKTLYKS